MDPEAFVILSVFLSCVCFLQNSKVAVSFLTVARRFFLTLTLRFDFFAQWFKFSHRLVRFLLTYLLTYFTCLHIYLFIDLFIYLEYAHCRRRATRRFPADTGLERAIDRRTARPLRERWPPSRVDSEFERERKRERATYVLRFHAATSASSPARAPPQRHC